jgi:hypothetical protein
MSDLEQQREPERSWWGRVRRWQKDSESVWTAMDTMQLIRLCGGLVTLRPSVLFDVGRYGATTALRHHEAIADKVATIRTQLGIVSYLVPGLLRLLAFTSEVDKSQFGTVQAMHYGMPLFAIREVLQAFVHIGEWVDPKKKPEGKSFEELGRTHDEKILLQSLGALLTVTMLTIYHLYWTAKEIEHSWNPLTKSQASDATIQAYLAFGLLFTQCFDLLHFKIRLPYRDEGLEPSPFLNDMGFVVPVNPRSPEKEKNN